ncbi:MAG: VCBS repeat-containing protein [Deltaproteobacteria bacterium]|nr:VCBS repeat-containing protein [Deltaproteobacteria bacterium]
MRNTRCLRKKAILPFIWLLVPFIFLSRASAAEKEVALLPLALYADPGKDFLRRGVKSMLASRLSGEGLQVVGDQVLAPFFREGETKSGITSPERAAELAALSKAGYAVFGSITGTGTGYSLDLSLLDRTKDKFEITNISEAVTEDQLIPKMADVAYDFRAVIAGVDIRKNLRASGPTEADSQGGLFFTRSETPYRFQPTGRISVKTQVMSLDAGDLDGDGQVEVVALGKDKLMIYKRNGETLEQQDILEADRGEQLLKVSLGDMDQNGRDEIYLVSFYGERAHYRILEWFGKFKALSDRQAGHIHVARSQTGRNDHLLYQDSSTLHFHDGDVWLMEVSTAPKLSKKEKLPFLKKAQIYTIILVDLDQNGVTDFVGLGEPRMDGTASIQSWDMTGRINWVTQEKVGGTNNAIDLFVRGPHEAPITVAFNSRLAAMDVDGDGKKEILVADNEILIGHLDFKHYVDGRLAAYKLEGGTFVEAFKSRKIAHCITDMQVAGETLFISAQKPQLSKISEGSSRILWFEEKSKK